jgi:hypothetical protein
MKKITLLSLVIALLGASCPALAVLSLTQLSPIGFGLILPNAPAAAGSVRIAKTANTRTVVSGSYVFALTGTSGAYRIDGGTSGQTVSITITPGTIPRTAGGSLTVTNITTNMASVTGGTGSNPVTGTLTFNGLGQAFLQVGCDLAIGGNQPAGGYSGTLSVSLS